MKITIPKQFMGKPIEGSLERVLAGTPVPSLPQTQPTTNPPTPITGILNPENYIILEGRSHGKYSYSDLVVAMELSHKGLNWRDSHEALYNNANSMLTIRQFVDFLNLLKSGRAFDGKGRSIDKSKLDSIFKEITEVRDPYRSEWLDADFKVNGNKLDVKYNHTILGGKLTPQRTEELEGYLATDKRPGIDLNDWLARATYQGLPASNVKDGSLYYWAPVKDNNSVAGFYADSDVAWLNCIGNPTDAGAGLGVRAVRKKIRPLA